MIKTGPTGESSRTAAVDRPGGGTSATGSGPWGAVKPPAGFRVLVPGYAQWSWGQRERGLVFFGWFASAAGVGVFAWGTAAGFVMLAFAFGAHAVSAVDGVRRSAFPGPGRWATLLGVPLGLAVAGYVPVLAVASIVAWPGMQFGPAPEGYLVDRWAYRSAEPRPGDWVWYRPSPRGEPTVGRVVAGRGQDVEWSENRLRVDGHSLATTAPSPLRSGWAPRSVSYRVPDWHVLVSPGADPSPSSEAKGVMIVSREQVVGRAWARMYPVRGRRLLP